VLFCVDAKGAFVCVYMRWLWSKSFAGRNIRVLCVYAGAGGGMISIDFLRTQAMQRDKGQLRVFIVQRVVASPKKLLLCGEVIGHGRINRTAGFRDPRAIFA
jgi:hypothetical protein